MSAGYQNENEMNQTINECLSDLVKMVETYHELTDLYDKQTGLFDAHELYIESLIEYKKSTERKKEKRIRKKNKKLVVCNRYLMALNRKRLSVLLHKEKVNKSILRIEKKALLTMKQLAEECKTHTKVVSYKIEDLQSQIEPRKARLRSFLASLK
jgi:hypothetical protein